MCEKCAEFDSKIEHYQRIASHTTDQPMLDGIKELIERMQAQKLALHPGQTE
jgi:beta-phosphoglucomutase-like phosphatase (HAD superfamily)